MHKIKRAQFALLFLPSMWTLISFLSRSSPNEQPRYCSLSRSLRENNGDDHAVETEGLTEDENEDHADEDFLLLSVCADASITNNTNSETSCERWETASQAGGQMLVTISISVGDVLWEYYIINLGYLDTALFNKAVIEV